MSILPFMFCGNERKLSVCFCSLYVSFVLLDLAQNTKSIEMRINN